MDREWCGRLRCAERLRSSMITFRTIRPGAFDFKAFEKELRNAQKEWMLKVLKEYRGTTKYWKHKVAFFGRGSERGVTTKIEVGYDDEIYGYVDEGTRAHIIRPKRPGGVLAFPSKSTPKTKPGRLRSGYGRKGKTIVFAKKVRHPGIKPRGFSPQIKKKMEPILETDMQNAMGRGAKKSGHAI